MSSRDLIDAIAAGDSTAIQAAFSDVMSSKVAERLDVMQQSVAQNMFRDPVAEQTQEVSEEVIDEAATPTGIKIYHTDKAGKPSHTIVFTAQDAQRHEKQLKKAGGTVTHRSVMYGEREGKKVAAH